MTTQTYVTYIAQMASHLPTFVWSSMLEAKELLWTQESGGKLISWLLACFSAMYLASHLLSRWRLAFVKAQSPVNGDILSLMERIRSLESRQESHLSTSSAACTIAAAHAAAIVKFSLAERLGSLEGKMKDLENSAKPFAFQSETSIFGRQGLAPTTTSCSSGPRTASRPSQNRPNLKRVRRSEVRARCRNLYGNEWWNHPGKNKRMSQAKEFLESKTH